MTHVDSIANTGGNEEVIMTTNIEQKVDQAIRLLSAAGNLTSVRTKNALFYAITLSVWDVKEKEEVNNRRRRNRRKFLDLDALFLMH